MSIQLAPSGYMEDSASNQADKRELEEETGYEAKKIVSLGYYILDYSMFEHAYDLINNIEEKRKQSFGKMEKIEIDIITIYEIKQLLSEGKI
jgi:ADP-ribose pyrophosphatase